MFCALQNYQIHNWDSDIYRLTLISQPRYVHHCCFATYVIQCKLQSLHLLDPTLSGRVVVSCIRWADTVKRWTVHQSDTTNRPVILTNSQPNRTKTHPFNPLSPPTHVQNTICLLCAALQVARRIPRGYVDGNPWRRTPRYFCRRASPWLVFG